MPSGTVCTFNDINGSGFILPDIGSERIHVSYREIKEQGYKILHEGQRVIYDVKKMKNGLNTAINVKSVEKALETS
jgi:cold shock protein